MELISAARDLRASSSRIHRSQRRAKPSRLGFSIGAFFALVVTAPLFMTDAQATTAVGAIAGSAGVSATGAATYTIPITLPPGTNGMQPSLALVYSSQSGDGLAGYGWTLAGMSSITRCAQDAEDDTQTLPIQYVAADDYCLDGQRLALITGTQGHAGATYGTQIEQFSLITSFGGSNGPGYFTVQTKDGRTYEYGNTTDSKIYAVGIPSTNTVRVWALDRVTDANGNYMTYDYGSNSTGTEYFPTEIDYTSNGGTAADHKVTFTYQTRPTQGSRGFYVSGSLITNTQELLTITVATGSVSYGYTLGYGQDSVSRRPQLQSVTECGTDGSCMPATTINWQNAQAGWGTDQSTGVAVVGTSHALTAHLVDVDGDGIKDLVYTDGTTMTWRVMFGLASGGFTAPVDTGEPTSGSSANALALDYNGDGLTDIAIPAPGVGGWQVMRATGSRAPGMGNIFITPANNMPDLSAHNSTNGLPMYEGNVWPVSFTGNGAAEDLIYSGGTQVNLSQNNVPTTGNFVSAGSVFSDTGTTWDVNEIFGGAGRGF